MEILFHGTSTKRSDFHIYGLAAMQVEPCTSVPLVVVTVTTIVSFLLSLINISSKVAFQDVLFLVNAGLFTSYLLGNSLLLWHRLQGTISPYEDAQGGPTSVVQAGKLSGTDESVQLCVQSDMIVAMV